MGEPGEREDQLWRFIVRATFIQQQTLEGREIAMRARSGAIHSDSEENFTRLAEISNNHTGIFYDERLNRKAMARLPRPKAAAHAQHPLPPDPAPPALPHRRNPFSEFDFNIEFEGIRQEREELERRQDVHRQVNVAILSSDPQATRQHLCSSLGLQEARGALQGVDLVVGVAGDTVYKYWVFGSSLEEEPLLGLYLARCTVVLDVREAEHAVNVVRCTLDWDGLSRNILTPLDC